MRFDKPVHNTQAYVPVYALRFGPSLVIPDCRRVNPSRNMQRHAFDFLYYLEQDKDIVVFRVPMPENIFNAPLGEQAIDFTLSVKSFQLRSLVRQVRVITINLQNLISFRKSKLFFEKKKKRGNRE
jgi:hypothetical protein